MPDLKEFESKVEKLKSSHKAGNSEPLPKGSKAFTICIELVSPIMVAGFIGYYLDKLFETKPWLLLVCLILGMIAGNIAVFRIINKVKNEP